MNQGVDNLPKKRTSISYLLTEPFAVCDPHGSLLTITVSR